MPSRRHNWLFAIVTMLAFASLLGLSLRRSTAPGASHGLAALWVEPSLTLFVASGVGAAVALGSGVVVALGLGRVPDVGFRAGEVHPDLFARLGDVQTAAFGHDQPLAAAFSEGGQLGILLLSGSQIRGRLARRHG